MTDLGKTAYAVLVIDTKTIEIKGVGIFSETTPTLGSAFPISLFDCSADSYEEAEKKVENTLKNNHMFSWLWPVYKKR